VEASIAPKPVEGRPRRPVSSTTRVDVRPCPELRRLEIVSWPRELIFTGGSPTLTDLGLSGTTLGVDTTFFDLPALTALDMSFCSGCADLKALRGCSSLQRLNLSNSDIMQTAMFTLANLKQLQVLNLHGCWNVTDVSPLHHCINLIDVAPPRTIVACSFYHPWRSLLLLDLETFTVCVHIVPLLRDACGGLKTLNLAESDADDSCVAPLGAMRALETLQLRGCRHIMNVSALANAISLTYLCLRRTRVSSTGIIGLQTLPLLATLLLDDTSIDDVQCLQPCPALTWQDISGTRVRDVTPLAQIASLRVLVAARTLVADFTPVMRKHLTLRLN
jgi:Leucine-rich repeat (LRR) protein